MGRAHPSNHSARGVLPTPTQTEGAPNPLPLGLQPFPAPREAQSHLLLPARSPGSPRCAAFHTESSFWLRLRASRASGNPGKHPHRLPEAPASPVLQISHFIFVLLVLQPQRGAGQKHGFGENAQKRPFGDPWSLEEGRECREGSGRAQARDAGAGMVAGEAACAAGNPLRTR